VPAELHVYSNAGHGFGYRAGTTSGFGDWQVRFEEWLVDSSLLTRK
jgi:endo-1,4-beta-xylanase